MKQQKNTLREQTCCLKNYWITLKFIEFSKPPQICFQPVGSISVYLFFGLTVLKSPVGEGLHLFKFFFLSVQHLAQVHNHLEGRMHHTTSLSV